LTLVLRWLRFTLLLVARLAHRRCPAVVTFTLVTLVATLPIALVVVVAVVGHVDLLVAVQFPLVICGYLTVGRCCYLVRLLDVYVVGPLDGLVC